LFEIDCFGAGLFRNIAVLEGCPNTGRVMISLEVVPKGLAALLESVFE